VRIIRGSEVRSEKSIGKNIFQVNTKYNRINIFFLFQVLCRASYKVILGKFFFAWLFQWLIYREDGQVYVACGGPPTASWSQMTNSGVRDRKEEKSSPKKITVHLPSPLPLACLALFPLSPEQKKIV
jgi:hypothetical protein